MSSVLNFKDEEFQNNENAILVTDSRFSVYRPRMESDGVVYVEKCVVRKSKYVPTEPLSVKSDKNNAYLVKETNFQDIGGGLRQFERHYATLPDDWFDFERVSYRALWWGAINYRSTVGRGSSWDKTRVTLAKANRKYLLKDDVPTVPVPEGDNVGQTYVDDFDFIYTIAPESRLGRNWDAGGTNGTTIAIAPDRVVPYLGQIYEFTRYTMTI
jgi:hypothetical protein